MNRKYHTITEEQAEQVHDSLLKLEANINNGLLSPNDTAKQIRLINELFCDLTNPNKYDLIESEIKNCYKIILKAVNKVAFDDNSEQVVISRNDCFIILNKLITMYDS
jgi:hypothetical protein